MQRVCNRKNLTLIMRYFTGGLTPGCLLMCSGNWAWCWIRRLPLLLATARCAGNSSMLCVGMRNSVAAPADHAITESGRRHKGTILGTNVGRGRAVAGPQADNIPCAIGWSSNGSDSGQFKCHGAVTIQALPTSIRLM